MKQIIERIEAILKNDKASLNEFQNLEEGSTDEYIFEGRIEALESVLEIMRENSWHPGHEPQMGTYDH